MSEDKWPYCVDGVLVVCPSCKDRIEDYSSCYICKNSRTQQMSIDDLVKLINKRYDRNEK